MAKTKQSIARLSPQEVDILEKGQVNPDIISDYFFTRPGVKQGWRFDDNFTEDGKWQREFHFASQKRIVVIGGFGTGKTRTVGVSGSIWSMVTTDFRFLNCAPFAFQSVQMYQFILELLEGTRAADLIYSKPRTPYPTIEFRFYIGELLMISKMEFMSVDKNANQILSWEGDWINIDEAGLLTDLSGTIVNLSSRLRGQVNGRTRLGRLSLTTNSWDNPELWDRYDLGLIPENADDYLSITVSSRSNLNVTPEQLKLLLVDIPEDERDQFIDGSRPEGMGTYFNKKVVYSCEDESLDHVIKNTENGKFTELRGYGYNYFEIKPMPGSMYMIFADPGTGKAPFRNAPVIQVWDVLEFPYVPMQMVGFWWGDGNKKIYPFIKQLFYFMGVYNPIVSAIDSTSTQKYMAETINSYVLGNRISKEQRENMLGNEVDISKISNPRVLGLDFSSTKKRSYLVSARIMIEGQLMKWPKGAKGMRSQLTNYDPEKDKETGNLAQDIVATTCMAAYGARIYFNITPESIIKKEHQGDYLPYSDINSRSIRIASEERTNRLPSFEESLQNLYTGSDLPRRS